jgi:hypothetical protein
MIGEMKMEDMLPLITEALDTSGEFVFYPRGISMLPTIVQLKDKVKLIKPDNIKKYSIVLYRRTDGKFVLHRIVKKPNNGIYTMCGDNQVYYERGIKKEQIIAAVSEIIRENGNAVSCCGTANYLYGVWIRAYRFPNRLYLALRHRIRKLLKLTAK